MKNQLALNHWILERLITMVSIVFMVFYQEGALILDYELDSTEANTHKPTTYLSRIHVGLFTM